MTMTSTQRSHRALSPRIGQLVRDSTYVLLGFPIAILALTALLTGLSVGVSLAFLIVGVPVLLATLGLARRLAAVERWRIGTARGLSTPAPEYRRAPMNTAASVRVRTHLQDRQAWRDLAHGILRVLPSTAAFVVVVTWWTGAVAGLTAPVWDHLVSSGSGAFTLADAVGLADQPVVRIAVNVLLGIVFLLTLAPVVGACAGLEARFALRFLGGGTRPARPATDQLQVVDVERGVFLLNK
jgi:putative sensor protein